MITEQDLTPCDSMLSLHELDIGQYLLMMRDKRNDSKYWAVGSVSQGGNGRLVVIDGHFSFDIGDEPVGYLRLPDAD